MKTEVLLIITISIPYMVPNMPVPMVIIRFLPMVVISMSSLAKKENK